MNQPTYARMLAEHAEIEAAAERLVDGLGGEAIQPRMETYARLCLLAALVEEHLVAEDGVVADVNEDAPKGPWADRWMEGHSAFERLKSDWLEFLARWTRDAIEANYTEFRFAARAMVRRLKERLSWETREFYAVALQTGAIVLRSS